MSPDEIRQTVLDVLGRIAPETDFSTLDARTNLRDQLDIDSMDFLNFLIALDKEFHVEIPERDYGKLSTLDDCVSYIAARSPG